MIISIKKEVLPMTSFSENLKRLRLERKMTQDELAELLKTSKQVISRYENGQRSPKVSTVAAFAEALNVPIVALTDGHDAQSIARTDREQLRRDPDRRVLFDFAENGSKRAVKQAVAILDALKRTNPDFYDGDDPTEI